MTGDFAEVDIAPAPKLMEVVLQNCKGRVDTCIALYIKLCVAKLALAERSTTKVLLLLVVANTLYYNAGLAVQTLRQQNATQTVFNTWFEMILSATQNEKWKYFKRVHDKKVS